MESIFTCTEPQTDSLHLEKNLSMLTGDSGPRLNVLPFIGKGLFPFIHFLDSGLFSSGEIIANA